MNLSQCSAREDSPWIQGAPQSWLARSFAGSNYGSSRSSDGRLISNANAKTGGSPDSGMG